MWHVSSCFDIDVYPIASFRHSRQNVTGSGMTSGVSGLAFTPDGKMLAAISNDRSIRFWNSVAWS